MHKFLLFLTFAFLFQSCDKVENPVQDNAAIPDAVIASVRSGNTDASGITITVVEAGKYYQADFQSQQNTYQAILNQTGKMRELRVEVTAQSFPASLQPNLDLNYPGAVLNLIQEDLDPVAKTVRGYAIRITTAASDRLQLAFDATGAFIAQSAYQPATTDFTNYALFGADELPVAIASYLGNQDAGYQFLTASVVVEHSSATYFVKVSNKDQIHFYQFDESAAVQKFTNLNPMNVHPNNGNIKGSQILSGAVPVLVLKYLTNNYPGWVILKGEVDSDDITGLIVGYVFVVQVGTDVYAMQFDANGNFLGSIKLN